MFNKIIYTPDHQIIPVFHGHLKLILPLDQFINRPLCSCHKIEIRKIRLDNCQTFKRNQILSDILQVTKSSWKCKHGRKKAFDSFKFVRKIIVYSYRSKLNCPLKTLNHWWFIGGDEFDVTSLMCSELWVFLAGWIIFLIIFKNNAVWNHA